MTDAFEIVACHGDHAGKAHLSIRCLDGGVEIAIQHMPFEAAHGEALPAEQARILALAAQVARDAARFLQAEAALARGWPTHKSRRGANAFGYPLDPG